MVRPGESREHKRSVAMDKVLTGKYTALPCFIGIMALVFWLTFGVIGAALSDLLTLGIDARHQPDRPRTDRLRHQSCCAQPCY